MRSPSALRLFAVLLFVWGSAAGCASFEPSRYYILNAMPESGKTTPGAASGRPLMIALGPVKLPPYLDRPQIVTRVGPNELHLAELDQWAEPLESNFTRVLARNLSSLLTADAVIVFPWRGSTSADYRVVVDVLRFDGELGGGVFLTARWEIVREGSGVSVLTRTTDLRDVSGADGYRSLVSAESRMVERLSRLIARAIRALPEAVH